MDATFQSEPIQPHTFIYLPFLGFERVDAWWWDYRRSNVYAVYASQVDPFKLKGVLCFDNWCRRRLSIHVHENRRHIFINPHSFIHRRLYIVCLLHLLMRVVSFLLILLLPSQRWKMRCKSTPAWPPNELPKKYPPSATSQIESFFPKSPPAWGSRLGPRWAGLVPRGRATMLNFSFCCVGR